MSILNDPSLRNQLINEGYLSAENCTPEENERFQSMVESGQSLPAGIFSTAESEYEFLRISPADLTPAEESNLIQALMLKRVSSIKSWVTFFGVMAVIGLLFGLISLIVS